MLDVTDPYDPVLLRNPTAEGVGRATTRTVVTTSIAVLFFNYMITAIYI